MESPPWTVTAFQRARRDTWRAIRIWFLVLGQFTWGLVSLVATGAAVIGITVGVRRHYRCPKCNAVPTGTWSTVGLGSFGLNRGVAINPCLCPNCGAPLSKS